MESLGPNHNNDDDDDDDNSSKVNEITPLRRSARLKKATLGDSDGSSPPLSLENKSNQELETERFPISKEKEEEREKSSDKCNYESLRNARISQNKARMELLGLHRSAGELNLAISSSESIKSERKKKNQNFEGTPLRRSSRLRPIHGDPNVNHKGSLEEKGTVWDPHRRRLLSSRCNSKGRGSIYDTVLGICCHFCRQKKLCGEEDCKRCGDGDINQPCIGKTECSVCHSFNGVLCRACLKVRYGEEMEEVRRGKDWMCPHCIEERGINPFWICNSSLCLKKRNMVPTGIAIYEARQRGYKSVAHLLMDELKLKHEIS